MSEFINNNIEPSVLTQNLLNDFGLVLYEIDNCRRQIAVYLIIGKAASKNKNNDLDNLCGWGQDALLRLIVIDSFKIRDDSKKIIKSIIDETKYSGNAIELFKAAEFDKKIKLLDKTINPWRPYRNKKYAHMEREQLGRDVWLKLIDLASDLKSLKNSIDFLIHYLSNPRYMPLIGKKDMAPYNMPDEERSERLFYEQMKDDRVIKKMNQLIENMSTKRELTLE